MTQLDLLAERRHRTSRATALRLVLSDGEWHTSTELVSRVGHRFGSAILIISRGGDGRSPWLIERQPLKSDGSVWRYRFVRVLEPHEVETEESWKARALRLEKENAALRAQLARVAT